MRLETWRIRRAIRFWCQRRIRGFDDSETWDLYTRLARHILPRLRRFQKVQDSYPSELTKEAWSKVLSKMILAFDLISKDRDDPKDEFDIREGLRLFAEYYRGLWL